MEYYFCVITEVPDNGKDNLCNAAVYRYSGEYEEEWGINFYPKEKEAKVKLLHEAKQEVFQRGELLILDKKNDREIPCGRKPEKWMVGYEIYESLDDAIERAELIFNLDEDKPSSPPEKKVVRNVSCKRR